MRSSTSSSEPAFAGRAVLLCLVVLGTAVAGGQLVGRLHRPRPLVPDAAQVQATPRLVLLIGNSRFEAGIDPARLEAGLGDGTRVRFAGALGWDSLHYHGVAAQAAAVLRPGRDVVLMEVSPLSLDDSTPNRLGAVARSSALELAALPGAPLETRLTLLLGLATPLYRFRVPLWRAGLQPRLERATARLVPGLARLGLIGPPRRQLPWVIKEGPGQVAEVLSRDGDRQHLLQQMRPPLLATLAGLRVGGHKMEALRRAVGRLTARGLRVVLVETPVSSWLRQRMMGPPHLAYRRGLAAIAAETGASEWRDWPAELGAQPNFFDDTHLVEPGRVAFTRALAARLAGEHRD
jgi:hypothetical protein